jgi:RimJ/RimL family protein N-acetyltransferase
MPDTCASYDEIDAAARAALSPAVVRHEWRRVPPALRGPGVLLRALGPGDAPRLLTWLSPHDIGRLTTSPASDRAGIERFIDFTEEQREAGEALCFGVVPAGCDHPVGIFHVRRLDGGFTIAEWSFALARPYWGEGLFYAAAPLVIEFVFDVVGARRLEARAAVRNGRGNGALRKLGAVQEALLRESLEIDGEPMDQVLWAILADEWRALCPVRRLCVH